jgi:hypothetical protein
MGNLSKIEIPSEPGQPVENATPAARYLCQHFHLNPLFAELVASLAGLGPDRRAA